MLKHSETIVNINLRRQDTTWDYRWDYYNPSKEGTIYLDPEMTLANGGSSDGWRFCGDADEPTLVNPYEFDRDQPIFQYEVNDSESGEGPDVSTDDWDSEHPRNLTRYLSPGDSKFLKIAGNIKNITVDPVPPKFISDEGTEYLSIESIFDGKRKNNVKYSSALRTLSFEFNDEIGLDYKQVALYIGDKEIDWGNITSLTDDIIYYYDRSLEKSLQQDYVDSISFEASKSGNYKFTANLYEKWADITAEGELTNEQDIKDIINEPAETIEIKKGDSTYTKEKYVRSKINLIVWDLAGNYSIYHIVRPFNTLSIEDLNHLVPINILFTSIEPDNYYLSTGIEGKIITKLQNTNECLFEYENVANLIEGSVGLIDLRSYDADNNCLHNPLDGIREFIIQTITESGNVKVEAWVQTGFSEVDEVIKDKTYNTAICGPWVYGDEGRKYDVERDVPKYLKGTQFGDFVGFFQLYLNTIYKGLDSNKNISALEKIARIGNMNDIQQIEDALVYHYAKSQGNEFDFNVESLKNVNLINNGIGFTERDTKETFDIIKYVLEQLPSYNSYKGTNTAVIMAIKMFGFTCKIIQMWIEKENEVVIDPTFIEEDRLYSKNEYFQTSRFNIELDGTTNLFEVFNNNIDMFIKLVKSIKPLCKILNDIKYTVSIDKDLNLIYDLNQIEDDTNKVLQYDMTWTFNNENLKALKNIETLCKLDEQTGTADLFCLNYYPELTISGDNVNNIDMVHDLLGKFFNTHYGKMYLRFNNENETITYEFDETGLLPVLSSGSLFIYYKNAAEATNGYNIIKKFFNNFEAIRNGDSAVTVELSFKLQHGTDFGESIKPS